MRRCGMICPFCGKEMRKGVLSGDRRCGVSWKEGDRKASLADRIVGACRVTAAKFTPVSFLIDSWFCPDCGKMIFDTDVAK